MIQAMTGWLGQIKVNFPMESAKWASSDNKRWKFFEKLQTQIAAFESFYKSFDPSGELAHPKHLDPNYWPKTAKEHTVY
jgi:hypothetical protein